jgi:choline-sulfatase
LITHLDEQIGIVLQEMKSLQIFDDTRMVYTSDHGELFGAQGLFGKRCLLEGSAGVPLILAGPGIAAGHVSQQMVSHVDLFPTIVDLAGGQLAPADADLPGHSLWPATQGQDDLDRPVFAEYHAQGSRTGAYLVRQHGAKMIFHVGMPTQAFDLAADPDELHDLHGTPAGDAIERALAADWTAEACQSVSVDTATPGDLITSDNTLTVTGTAEPGSTVNVYDNGVVVGTESTLELPTLFEVELSKLSKLVTLRVTADGAVLSYGGNRFKLTSD